MSTMTSQSPSLPSHLRCLKVNEVSSGNYEATVVRQPTAALPKHDLLIQVNYSSLNYIDALSLVGDRSITQYPRTPGCDAAGVVVHDESGLYNKGQEVIVTGFGLGALSHGGLSEYISVPVDWAVPLPEGLSLRESMIYGTAGLTAAMGIDKLLKMGAHPEQGEVAVTGASGGVGSMSLAILAQLGFSVAAITGKLDNSERLVALGATKIIDLTQLVDDKASALRKDRWCHAMDCLGGEPLVSLLKAVQYGGSVVSCGLSSSPIFKSSVYPFISKDINLLGVDAVNQPIERKQSIWNKLASDWYVPKMSEMAHTISLEQVPLYLTQIANGHAVGRYLVEI